MKKSIPGIAVLAVFLFAIPLAQAQLKPPQTDLTGIVKDKNWALILGKALFWDQQIGSDKQACASCHFAAGADIRTRNALSPGFNDITISPTGDTKFGSTRSDTGDVLPGHMPSGVVAIPDYLLTPQDMPLHQLKDETDRNSLIRTTTNDRVGSEGSYDSVFDNVRRFLALKDLCNQADGSIFYAGKYPARQVEPRHTPSTINAAFYNRNFWDGRANNTYNGVGVFGMRDVVNNKSLGLIALDTKGKPYVTTLAIPNASLASQSMAPPISAKEMSCNGRDFADIGRKMMLRIPLEIQAIHSQDSLFGKNGPYGDLRTIFGIALKSTYGQLIKNAFQDTWWKGTGYYKIDNTGKLSPSTLAAGGYTQMEQNFSMFWGIAIMLYEQTLISDQSEFDTLTASHGGQPKLVAAPVGGCFDISGGTIDPLFMRGCNIFFKAGFITGPDTITNPNGSTRTINGAACTFCHSGPVFSEASIEQGPGGGTFTPFLAPVPDVNNNLDIRDLGFASIGLRPVFSDLNLGGTDPYGGPLSYGRQFRHGTILDPFLKNAITAGNIDQSSNLILNGIVTKLETDGATKIPTLRNIMLNPPYFSWGGYPNLRQVMKTYNRGLNRRDIPGLGASNAEGTGCTSGDNSGTGPNGDPGPYPSIGSTDCNTNTSGLILPLGLLDCDANGVTNPTCTNLGYTTANDDLAALVRFFKSLTDFRVQCDKMPFDHPSLIVTNGHTPTDVNRDGLADDINFILPAVGANGYDPSSGYCIPNAGDLFAPGMQGRAGGPRVPLTP